MAGQVGLQRPGWLRAPKDSSEAPREWPRLPWGHARLGFSLGHSCSLPLLTPLTRLHLRVASQPESPHSCRVRWGPTLLSTDPLFPLPSEASGRPTMPPPAPAHLLPRAPVAPQAHQSPSIMRLPLLFFPYPKTFSSMWGRCSFFYKGISGFLGHGTAVATAPF